ncbi:FIST N-terminal domain-containing protein [Polyangium sp. 15x6]|uniref:FIST signal transduction protein n=1 Tax=Polyangium sp. 15x6 TaxID=3042687 RepID=UPI00249A16E3|nr:FIST N-terminal domain-containing protein [Polyangium sp. 15x6]MDI3290019.1 FIST N-terminal domain-containing protein [Polyangium sp. 15x6]
MIEASTVSIVHDDARRAGRDAADELIDVMGGRPDFVLLFGSAKYDGRAVLDGLRGRLGSDVRIAGCSSFAEIDDSGGLTESVTAMGLRLGGALRVTPLADVSNDGDDRALGRRLGERARALDPSLLLVFYDSLRVNGPHVLHGLHDVLGATFPMVGGGAGDLGQFVRAYQIADGEVLSGGASVVVFSGPIRIATAARSGWIPVGGEHRITGVEKGNVVRTIDDRPALELYQEYLGARAAAVASVAVEFPLAVVGGLEGTCRPAEGEIAVLRAVAGIDTQRKALILGGDLPEGTIVRMTTGTRDDVIRAAEVATERALRALPNPSCALLFDCMARKLVLGTRYRDELNKPLERLGSIPKAGFYTHGELSPVDGVCMCHNETFTIALLEG